LTSGNFLFNPLITAGILSPSTSIAYNLAPCLFGQLRLTEVFTVSFRMFILSEVKHSNCSVLGHGLEF